MRRGDYLLSRCLEIIGSAQLEHDSCRAAVEQCLHPPDSLWLEIERAIHFRMSAAGKNELLEMAKQLRSAAVVMAQNPLGSLLASRFHRPGVGESEPDRSNYFDAEWNWVSAYLAAAACVLEERATEIKPRKRPNFTKKVCASQAREILERYGQGATLSQGGAFFELASLLYEGQTGVPEQSLERACREEHRGQTSSKIRERLSVTNREPCEQFASTANSRGGESHVKGKKTRFAPAESTRQAADGAGAHVDGEASRRNRRQAARAAGGGFQCNQAATRRGIRH
jgi:hypothetical protein